MIESKEAQTPRKPRIAYLVNSYPSPSLVFVRREIEALERQGYLVDRYAVRKWPAQLVDPRDQAEQLKTCYLLGRNIFALIFAAFVVLVTSPRRSIKGLLLAWKLGNRSDRGRLWNLFYLVEACYLFRLLRRHEADWVHAHFGTNSTSVAMLSHELGGPPYSFTCHGPEEFDRPEALHLGDKIARAGLVIGVSQFGRSQLYRWCDHAHWSKLEVVHCGVDPSYLSLEPSTPPADRRLVSIGRLHEQKGTLLLVEAVRELAKETSPFEVVLVGDGPMRAQVESLIANYRLQRYVRLVGWQTHDQIQTWLRTSRALVLPSFAEGLPVVIMEALASYRPVVSTYVAGIPELVTPGECGWLVPAGDRTALCKALQTVLETPVDRLGEMGRAGARRVRQFHNIDHEALRLAELIAQRLQK